MKTERDWKPDLTNALPPMPDDCYQALMNAAYSVKEDEAPMKRNVSHVVLLTALILVLMMTAAYAAAQLLGLNDYFTSHLTDVGVPQSALNVLASTEQQSWQVGPVTYTLHETLCDGQIVYVTVQAKLTDGSKAVLMPSFDDPTDCVTQLTGQPLMNLPADANFLDSAKLLNAPLYSIDMDSEIPYELRDGEEMLAEMWDADGNLTLIDMVDLDPAAITGDTLSNSLYLRVRQLDETGNPIEGKDWTLTPAFTTAIHGVERTADYLPEAGSQHSFEYGAFSVQDAHMDFTCAGAYLTIRYTVDDAMIAYNDELGMEPYNRLHDMYPCDTNGQQLPDGMSLTSRMDLTDAHTITEQRMLGIDEAPETIVLADIYGIVGCEPITLTLKK